MTARRPAVAGASSGTADSTVTETATSGATMVDADAVALGVVEGVPPGALRVLDGEPELDGDARFVGVSDG